MSLKEHIGNGKEVTLFDLQCAMPAKKNLVTQEIVDIINKVQEEPEFQGESLMQTMVTYQSVLQKAKVGIKEYISAIRFCAYLISMDDNYTEAYKRTFYDRKFVKDRITLDTSDPRYGELTSAASRYRRSKLVVDILTLSQVPMELMFAGLRYKAVGVLANVMMTAKYDRDKIAAATQLLLATKSDNIKVDLDIKVNENSAVTDLRTQLAQMAATQTAYLHSGTATLQELGAMKPKGEYEDAEVE